MEPMNPSPSTPLSTEIDYRRNIGIDLLLTLLTCGLWNLVVQYHQCQTLNTLLRREKYNFWLVLLLSVLTASIYLHVHEYMKSRDFHDLIGQGESSEPILAACLSVFFMNPASVAILQSRLNDHYNRFPG